MRCDARLALSRNSMSSRPWSYRAGVLGAGFSALRAGRSRRFSAGYPSVGETEDAVTAQDPVAQNPWTLHFTDAETEREYFALQWGARRALLRMAVPAAVGPPTYCLQIHRMLCDSRNGGSTYVE